MSSNLGAEPGEVRPFRTIVDVSEDDFDHQGDYSAGWVAALRAAVGEADASIWDNDDDADGLPPQERLPTELVVWFSDCFLVFDVKEVLVRGSKNLRGNGRKVFIKLLRDSLEEIEKTDQQKREEVIS